MGDCEQDVGYLPRWGGSEHSTGTRSAGGVPGAFPGAGLAG